MSEPLFFLGIPSEVLLWQAVFLGLLSFGVGIMGGIVGLALGTVRLPFLLLFGMPAPIAAGTNILVSTLGALTGSFKHIRERRVDFQVVAIQGIPAVAGSFIGGFAAGLAHEGVLIFLAGMLVVWQGAELYARAKAQNNHEAHIPRPPFDSSRALQRWSKARIAAEGAAGFAIGLLGGAVGLILGTLRLPALIAILRIDPRVAAGSNLVIGFLMGGFGWVGHLSRGQVDFPILMLMALTGMTGTYLGSGMTGKMSLRSLLYLMAVVLVVVGSLLLRDAYFRF